MCHLCLASFISHIWSPSSPGGEYLFSPLCTRQLTCAHKIKKKKKLTCTIMYNLIPCVHQIKEITFWDYSYTVLSYFVRNI